MLGPPGFENGCRASCCARADFLPPLSRHFDGRRTIDLDQLINEFQTVHTNEPALETVSGQGGMQPQLYPVSTWLTWQVEAHRLLTVEEHDFAFSVADEIEDARSMQLRHGSSKNAATLSEEVLRPGR